MALIVDTSVLIEMERGDVEGTRHDPDLERRRQQGCAVSVVTVAELLVGVAAAEGAVRRELRAAFVEAVLTWLPAIEIDVRVARRYASLLDAGRRAGRCVNAHDGLIAATAQVIDAPVLTRSRRHFAAIPGTRLDPRSA